ncbi:DUF3575 domain-containing protein [Weeksellaceae bacterium A-14]|uniref:DUF3575 domain-containing protein n=1 Tax=Daejeonia sp. YH14 TaxID=3439042 RepID=UPI0031E4D52A
MKKFLITWAMLQCLAFSAQTQETRALYVKGNALFLPAGMLNVGAEYQIADKYTLQGEVFVSPWKSFGGHEMQVYMLGFQGRYYFSEAFRKFYVGADISSARFIMQKFNYWNDNIYYIHGTNIPTDHISSNLYQKGYAFMLGAVAGYQWKLNDRWNIDLYLTAGMIQSIYKGYDRTNGERYDIDVRRWDKSGEFLPYRGGVMISYKL